MRTAREVHQAHRHAPGVGPMLSECSALHEQLLLLRRHALLLRLLLSLLHRPLALHLLQQERLLLGVCTHGAQAAVCAAHACQSSSAVAADLRRIGQLRSNSCTAVGCNTVYSVSSSCGKDIKRA